MAAAGFTWTPKTLDASLAQAKSTIAERSQQFPYDANVEGPTYTPVQQAGITPRDGTPDGLSESELASFSAAMIGSWSKVVSVNVLGSTLETSSDGCITDARVAVYGTLEVAYFVESEGPNAVTRAANLARQSTEVFPKLKEWSACMLDSGYSFEDFTYARSAGLAAPDGGQAIARADDQCTVEVGLIAVFNEVYSEQLSAFEEEHLGELEHLGVERDLAINRAKTILGVA